MSIKCLAIFPQQNDNILKFLYIQPTTKQMQIITISSKSIELLWSKSKIMNSTEIIIKYTSKFAFKISITTYHKTA